MTPQTTDALPVESTFAFRHQVLRVAWSPDGTHLAAGQRNGEITLFRLGDRAPIATWQAHAGDFVREVSWHPDGELIASCGDDGTLAVWDWRSRHLITRVDLTSGWALRLAWSPDGRHLAVAPLQGPVALFDVEADGLRRRRDHLERARAVCWAPDSRHLACDTSKNDICLYDLLTGKIVDTFAVKFSPLTITWAHDGTLLAVGGRNGLCIYAPHSGEVPTAIEGPGSDAYNVQFSPDSRLLAVMGDNVIAVWRRDPWELVATLPGGGTSEASSGLAFRPDGSQLACVGTPKDKPYSQTITVWGVDPARLRSAPAQESVFYVTAKVALLGESGVGKTSLACRIVWDEFQHHPSTHGQRFWVVPELAGARADGAVCEAVLWDFAGQADYRLVHALLLDDVDVALVLFDPGSGGEPLKGVRYWLQQLRRGSRTEIRSILVGARMDRTGVSLSRAEIEAFCRENGISGGFVATSAATGEGIDPLRQCIRGSVGWEDIPPTITTTTFKRIKDFVLALKSDAPRGTIIPKGTDLIAELRNTAPEQRFRHDEVATAVVQLSKHGLVTPLRNAQGDEYVLLSPELLTSLASSVVLEVRRDPMELGTIDEQALLSGQYAFTELEGLQPHEKSVLLDAVVTLFIRHALCF
ncbi:MAG TPA: hypothetical protein VFR67_15000, partial [Pilimelia sp.]|nr:hypothetical protein [Pilimelia sp.]